MKAPHSQIKVSNPKKHTMKRVKKLILPLLCISVLSYSLTSCKDNQNEEPQEEETAEVLRPSDQIISNKEAKILFDDYDKNIVSVLKSKDDNYKPVRFVEYNLKAIKQYIAYVEQEAKQANKTEVATLRFYYGKYPEGERSGKNTMFIVPTTKFKGVNYNQGFYIEINKDGKKTAAPIIDSVRENEQGMGVIEEKSEKSYASILPVSATTNSTKPIYFSSHSLTMNRGTAGPPPKADY